MTRSQTKNQHRRSRKRKRGRQERNQLIRIPENQPGLYAQKDGGMDVPNKNSKRPQRPLSKRESDLLYTKKDAHHGVGPRCIYQVRAYRDEKTKQWLYEGRGFNSLIAFPLTPEWLTDNNMPYWWRKKTITRYPKYWFKCRILSTEDEMRPGCIPLAIIKFYNHVGMFDHAREMSRRWRHGLTSWGPCIDFMHSAGGFIFKKPNCRDLSANLLFGQQKCFFLMQISAISQSTGELDNLHAIGVFHGLIFDANHKQPLPLTKKNLDECCLDGPDWVFHHFSRVRQAIPSLPTATLIEQFNSKRLK